MTTFNDLPLHVRLVLQRMAYRTGRGVVLRDVAPASWAPDDIASIEVQDIDDGADADLTAYLHSWISKGVAYERRHRNT